jgi:hypothetical protein
MLPPPGRRAHNIDFAAIFDASAKTPPAAFCYAWDCFVENKTFPAKTLRLRQAAGTVRSPDEQSDIRGPRV